MESLIRKKYEKRMFCLDKQSNPPVQNVSEGGKYNTQMQTLNSMGFNDKQACYDALVDANGNVEIAVEVLVQKQKQTSSPIESQYQTQLKQIGFSDTAANEQAYQKAKGNMEQTVMLLIDAKRAAAKPIQTPPQQSKNELLNLLDSSPSSNSSYNNNNQFQQQTYANYSNFASQKHVEQANAQTFTGANAVPIGYPIQFQPNQQQQKQVDGLNFNEQQPLVSQSASKQISEKDSILSKYQTTAQNNNPFSLPQANSNNFRQPQHPFGQQQNAGQQLLQSQNQFTMQQPNPFGMQPSNQFVVQVPLQFGVPNQQVNPLQQSSMNYQPSSTNQFLGV
jgi:hypothetical protein